MTKRIISYLLCFAILICFVCAIPAFADIQDAMIFTTVSWADWIAGVAPLSSVTGLDWWKEFYECLTYDPDTYEEDFESAYQDYVSGLPSEVYTSGGAVFIPMYLVKSASSSCSVSIDDLTFSVVGNKDGYAMLYIDTGSSSSDFFGRYSEFYLSAGYAGTYIPVVYATTDNCSVTIDSSVGSGSFLAGDSIRACIGYSPWTTTFKIEPIDTSDFWSATGQFGFLFTPYQGVAGTTNYNTTYNSTTRVNNISMNYYNSSTQNVYKNVTIVNEDTNQYYDVSNDTYYDIDTWEYDYSTRTYDLTLSDGTDVEVEFGVDGLNITTGDGTITLEYALESDDSSGGGACSHDYEISDYQEPTCTDNGRYVYTCSICGVSYSDTVYATGHDYSLAEHVDAVVSFPAGGDICPTCETADAVTYVLDDTGESYTCTCSTCEGTWSIAADYEAAYDLYQCSKCGHEYRDYTGEGVDAEDSNYWSWLQRWLINFRTWLGNKLDELKGSGDVTEIEVTENDYDITYTQDDEEETFDIQTDFIDKFKWLEQVYEIGETLFSSVAADAAYAEAAALVDEDDDSGIMLADDTDDTQSVISDGAPSLTLEFGNSDGYFASGGDIAFLDLSWYTPYKPTVDNIVSGFLWLAFCWALFKKAPGIISGASMTNDRMIDIEDNKKR